MQIETKNYKIKIHKSKGRGFLTVYPSICCDCGDIIDLPSHRIPTNRGYVWVCAECKEKIKCKE